MRIRHTRRECGCWDHPWGSPYEEAIEHVVRVRVAPFAMRASAVTRPEYDAFVRASGYAPSDPQRFLAAEGGDDFPVTHVSIADARAFAAFHGERLPTEAEWQWAAEGAGLGRAFPWGDQPRAFPSRPRPARDASTATPQGVMGLSGNAWELTESEHDDGHTRFVMLRGGVWLPPGASEWLPERGARPNQSHAKYILLADGLDRSETVSFRTVVDL
jgi:formylglycine-generating enzyme required for sulfatase activity